VAKTDVVATVGEGDNRNGKHRRAIACAGYLVDGGVAFAPSSPCRPEPEQQRQQPEVGDHRVR
jgi:hypothetical protein